jgi:hypothetical protein
MFKGDVSYRASRCAKLISSFLIKEVIEMAALSRHTKQFRPIVRGTYLNKPIVKKFNKYDDAFYDKRNSQYSVLSLDNEFRFDNKDFESLYIATEKAFTGYFARIMGDLDVDNFTIKSEPIREAFKYEFEKFRQRRKKSKMDYEDFIESSSLSEVNYISYNQTDYEVCLFMKLKFDKGYFKGGLENSSGIYSWRIQLGRYIGRGSMMSTPEMKQALSDWEPANSGEELNEK